MAVPDHVTGWDRTFLQMWEMHFKPEIEARQKSGAWSLADGLYIAQVLFPIEGEPKVLFNDEVTGDAVIKADRAINKGDQVTRGDLERLEGYELSDDLLDCGHFTIVRSGEGWKMIFNFQSGRAKALGMLAAAQQFLTTARTATEQGFAGPAVENLFTACELTSKATLILHRSKAAEAKSHKTVSSEINIWAKLGNIDAAFVALFNKITQQRPNARYGDAKSKPPLPSGEDFELVHAMIVHLQTRVGRQTDQILGNQDKGSSITNPEEGGGIPVSGLR